MNRKASVKLIRRIVASNNLDVEVTEYLGDRFTLTGLESEVKAVHEVLRGMGYPVLVDYDTALILA